MRIFATYILGALFALVLATGGLMMTTQQQDIAMQHNNTAYVQSLQASLMAKATLDHALPSAFVCSTNASGVAQSEQSRSLVRVVKPGSEILMCEQLHEVAQQFDSCHRKWHLRAGRTAPRTGVDYYIYTLRKIVI